MTLADLLARLYKRLNYQSVPAPEVVARLTDFLNEAQRRLLRTPGLTRLKATTGGIGMLSDANRAVYGLPPAISRVLQITDLQSDRRLVAITLSEVRSGDPGLSAFGTPYAYIPLGFRALTRQPQSTGLWVVSDLPGDSIQAVQITGIRAGGFVAPEVQANLNGLTRVPIGVYPDYIDVTSVNLSAVCAGTVSIMDAAVGGNVIAQIGAGALSSEYVCIQLYPTPQTAGIPYRVDGTLKMPQMDDPYDVPVLPEDFHEVLVHGALVLEYEKQDDPRLAMAEKHYREGLSALKYHVASQGDAVVFGGAPPIRTSRLGPWTPAD